MVELILVGRMQNTSSTRVKRCISDIFDERLSLATKLNKCCALLSTIEGFFAGYIKLDEDLIVFSDRIASIPAVYSVGKDIEVSLGRSAVQKFFSTRIISDEALKEVTSLGFVSNEETYIKDCKQVLPASIVHIDKSTGAISSQHYSKFLPQYDKAPIENYSERLYMVMKSAIVDYIENIDANKKFLVPLSGGYDSRFILTMLLSAGVSPKRILTFTYGETENREVDISRQVAASLNVDWRFVQTDRKFWKKWVIDNSSLLEEYTRFAVGPGNCPVYQDWPVIGSLLESGCIDSDFVVLPGHAGDFVAGSHMLNKDFCFSEASKQRIASKVLRRHFCLTAFGNSKCKRRMLSTIEEDYASQCEKAEVNSLPGYYEYWDWKERQSKLIANSVAVYEYWGLEWYMPFWSKRLYDFFLELGFDDRVGTTRYSEAVEKIYYREIGKIQSGSNSREKGNERLGTDRDSYLGYIKGKIKSYIMIIPYVKILAQRLNAFFRYRKNLNSHAMGWNHFVRFSAVKPPFWGQSIYAVFSKYSVSIITKKRKDVDDS